MGVDKQQKFKKARSLTCAGLAALLGVCFIIGGLLVVLLFRGFVNQLIMNEIPIKNGSAVAAAWKDPPVRPLMKLYFFNTTNPKGFLRGEKPSLVEMGPYTYEEQWNKVNVKWSQNGTRVSYQLKKTYNFRRDLSAGPETDRVTLPNVPMFASISQMRWAGKLVQQALGSMLEILRQEVFNSTAVGDIIWGYEHPLIKLGNDVLPPEKKLPFDEFGFFVDKNGSTGGVFEAMTGSDRVMDVGKVVSFNGKKQLDFWSTEECNAIKGTDGSIFHPDVTKNETLYIFNRDLCQSLPLVYQEEVMHQDINTYRFVPPANVFATPQENPYNKCFCSKKEGCSTPSGLFNVSICQFGSPMMLSWPHFFQADPRLLDTVEGLNPTKEKHQFQIDIIPKMGIGMRAAAKSQINLVMNKVDHVKQMEGVRDIIYPILWFSDGIDSLDDPATVSLLKTALKTPEVARSVMYPTMFIIGAILVIATVAFVVRKFFMNPEKVELQHVSESGGMAMSTGAQTISKAAENRSYESSPPPEYRAAYKVDT